MTGPSKEHAFAKPAQKTNLLRDNANTGIASFHNNKTELNQKRIAE